MIIRWISDRKTRIRFEACVFGFRGQGAWSRIDWRHEEWVRARDHSRLPSMLDPCGRIVLNGQLKHHLCIFPTIPMLVRVYQLWVARREIVDGTGLNGKWRPLASNFQLHWCLQIDLTEVRLPERWGRWYHWLSGVLRSCTPVCFTLEHVNRKLHLAVVKWK